MLRLVQLLLDVADVLSVLLVAAGKFFGGVGFLFLEPGEPHMHVFDFVGDSI